MTIPRKGNSKSKTVKQDYESCFKCCNLFIYLFILADVSEQ